MAWQGRLDRAVATSLDTIRKCSSLAMAIRYVAKANVVIAETVARFVGSRLDLFVLRDFSEGTQGAFKPVAHYINVRFKVFA